MIPSSLNPAAPATVFVQRPGEFPEEYERFPGNEQAEQCRSMLKRAEPFWRVWVA